MFCAGVSSDGVIVEPADVAGETPAPDEEILRPAVKVGMGKRIRSASAAGGLGKKNKDEHQQEDAEYAAGADKQASGGSEETSS